MKFTEENRAEGLQIDITPIVDTVFNLMIFFALSMNFMLNPGIKVELPESSLEEIVQKEREVTVSITREGNLMVDSVPVDVEQLLGELKKVADKNPQAVVVIQADRNVTHGRVVQIMDIARNSGMKKIAISTQFKPKEK